MQKVEETESITSFVFERSNGKEFPSFKAGQYLCIHPEVEGKGFVRNYSLSCGDKAAQWRISVKKEPMGLISGHLHDNFSIGDEIKVHQIFIFAPSIPCL